MIYYSLMEISLHSIHCCYVLICRVDLIESYTRDTEIDLCGENILPDVLSLLSYPSKCDSFGREDRLSDADWCTGRDISLGESNSKNRTILIMSICDLWSPTGDVGVAIECIVD